MKYKRVLFELKERIFELIGNGCRYSDIVAKFEDSSIKEQTISNIISQFNIEDDFMDYIPKTKIDIKDAKYLYIDTDDTFSTLRIYKKKQQCQIRLTTLYTGQKKDINNKQKLLDKRVFVKFAKKGTSINAKKYWLQLLNFIDSNYKNWNNCIFIIKGDGATWIKNLASYFNGYYVLDKFHLIKRLRSALSVNVKNSNFKEIQQIFKSAFSLFIKNTNYTDLFTYFRQTYQYLKLNKLLSDDKIKDLRNFLNYIASNKTHISNYYKDFDSRSHTEGQISSVIKQTLGYDNKIYNYYNFKKIMFIKLLRINEINISEAIFYNKKAYIDKKRQENFEDYTHYHNIFDYINKKKTKMINLGKFCKVKFQKSSFLKEIH